MHDPRPKAVLPRDSRRRGRERAGVSGPHFSYYALLAISWRSWHAGWQLLETHYDDPLCSTPTTDLCFLLSCHMRFGVLACDGSDARHSRQPCSAQPAELGVAAVTSGVRSPPTLCVHVSMCSPAVRVGSIVPRPSLNRVPLARDFRVPQAASSSSALRGWSRDFGGAHVHGESLMRSSLVDPISTCCLPCQFAEWAARLIPHAARHPQHPHLLTGPLEWDALRVLLQSLSALCTVCDCVLTCVLLANHCSPYPYLSSHLLRLSP